jgi:hypothetical protein
VDPCPALRTSGPTVRRGDDREDRIRGEPAAEFALLPRARLSQSQSLLGRRCSNLQVPESRSSGAIRSERAAGERLDQPRMRRVRTRWEIREGLSGGVARDVSVRSRARSGP